MKCRRLFGIGLSKGNGGGRIRGRLRLRLRCARHRDVLERRLETSLHLRDDVRLLSGQIAALSWIVGEIEQLVVRLTRSVAVNDDARGTFAEKETVATVDDGARSSPLGHDDPLLRLGLAF